MLHSAPPLSTALHSSPLSKHGRTGCRGESPSHPKDALPKTHPQRRRPPKTESHFVVSVCAFGLPDGRHFGYFQAYFARKSRPSNLHATCERLACNMRATSATPTKTGRNHLLCPPSGRPKAHTGDVLACSGRNHQSMNRNLRRGHYDTQ